MRRPALLLKALFFSLSLTLSSARATASDESRVDLAMTPPPGGVVSLRDPRLTIVFVNRGQQDIRLLDPLRYRSELYFSFRISEEKPRIPEFREIRISYSYPLLYTTIPAGGRYAVDVPLRVVNGISFDRIQPGRTYWISGVYTQEYGENCLRGSFPMEPIEVTFSE